MKVYYASDLHNDFHGSNSLLDLTGDTDAVLVVAGDINHKGYSVRDLDEVADRWRYVIAVAGNHCWYKIALHEINKFTSTKDNVKFLFDDHIILDDVVFMGGTAWHYIKPNSEFIWRESLNDSKNIRGVGYRRLYPNDINKLHQKTVEYIKKAKTEFDGYKKILITHHPLTPLSLDPKFSDDEDQTNQFYSSNLTELLDGFDVYIHGHVHLELQYKVYGCEVLCYPYGYGISENPEIGTLGVRLFDTDEY